MALGGIIIDREACEEIRKRVLKKEHLSMDIFIISCEIKDIEKQIQTLVDTSVKLCNEYKEGKLGPDYKLERMQRKLHKDIAKTLKKKDKLKKKLHRTVEEHNDLEVELLRIKNGTRRAV